MTIPDRFTIGGALLGLFLSYLYPSIQFVDGVASSSRFEAFGHLSWRNADWIFDIVLDRGNGTRYIRTGSTR